MPIITPETFRHENLYMDVEIQAVYEGNVYDMTGRKYFYARMLAPDGVEVNSSYNFKNNIGFGITNINVDVSTSLQPIIEITFKDLYGNTVFGKANSENIDYQAIFRWPPPKFLFTYKGYLGRQVSYMLSLKKIDTQFVSQDASYDIKVTFVPHQWGFFADIPFYFLYAVKGLKKKAGLLDSNLTPGNKEGTSLVDLLEIGASVEEVTNKITSRFDEIQGKMIDYRADIVGAIRNSVKDEEIKGSVDGKEIPGFQTIQVVQPEGGFRLGSVEGLNYHMMARMKINGQLGRYANRSIEQIQSLSNRDKAEIRDRALSAIKNNLSAIEDEIQRERFAENADKLRKLTISEVFNQIASDSAYLLGRILEAGFRGQRAPYDDETNPTTGRKEARESARDSRKIMGLAYPTIIDGEGGEDLPATRENISGDLQPMGVEDEGCEMDFVRDFIDAIVSGILEVNTAEQIAEQPPEENLISRINNLEVLSKNPYLLASNYYQFVENILARSAIVGWFTRSNDANLPGNYGSSLDRVGSSEIKEIAEHDYKNISSSLLKKIDKSNLSQIKKFATFWSRFLNSEGTNIIGASGEASGLDLESLLKSKPDDLVSDEILDFPVVINGAGFLNTQENVNTLVRIDNGLPVITSQEARSQGAEVLTARQLLDDIFNRPFGPLSTVNANTHSTDRFVNNRHLYFKPRFTALPAGVLSSSVINYILVFEGSDAEKIRNLNSAKSDFEYQNGTIQKSSRDFLGTIFIDSVSDGGEVREEVEKFNELVRRGYAVKYRAIKDISEFPEFYDDLAYQSIAPSDYMKRLRWEKQIEIPGESLSSNSNIGIDANNVVPAASLSSNPIAFKAFYSEPNSLASNKTLVSNVGYESETPYQRIAFDLWSNKDESKHQRIYLQTFCFQLLNDIQKIEREEQEIINRITNKAQQGEDVFYRQFKTFYQQWNTIAFPNVIQNGQLASQEVQEFRGLAERMMRDYGGGGPLGRGLRLGPGEDLSDGDSRQGIFVYDFPLQRIRENSSTVNSKLNRIDVRDSLINIDPLYNGSDSRTTVLNMFQTLCSKNNFMFIPIPGYNNYTSVRDIYGTFAFNQEQAIINYFHVMFIPTPESSSLIEQSTYTHPLELSKTQEDIQVEAFEVIYGSTENDIVKNVSVSTQDNKVTAESAINVQRLADNENRDRTVTRDCSILNVLAGRSYKASVDILGNAQVFPMQFFFIRNLPLFDGLYQILNVKHSITPNNFSTTFDGIRMRFNPQDGYGGIYPITLQTLEDLYNQTLIGPIPFPVDTDYIEANINNSEEEIQDIGIESSEVGQAEIFEDISLISDDNISSTEVTLGLATRGFQNSRKLQTSNNGRLPIRNSNLATKEQMIVSMNYFIRDVFEPWAVWLKQRYPNLYSRVYITSAIRDNKPKGGSSTSNHFRGQAIDFQISVGNSAAAVSQELTLNLQLFNTIMEWHRENPGIMYKELLLETREPASVWIHWAYSWQGDNGGKRKRFKNDKTLDAPMNGFRKVDNVSVSDAKFNSI